MPEIYIVEPEHLTEIDLALLEGAVSRSYFGLRKGDILRSATKQEMQIWRFSHEESHGLFVTDVRDNPDGKELFVWLIVGDGIFANPRNLHFALDRLEEFARAMDCRWISGLAIPRLVKFFTKKLGFRTPYVYISKEV